MGRKQTGERKYFFFYLTCIIILFYISATSGCISKTKHMPPETLDFIVDGNYRQALEKYQQLLKEYPQMADEVFFQMGLIYSHPENPDKDYKKSLEYFRKVRKEFPDSNLKNKAQIFASLLNKIIQQGQKNKEQRAEIVVLTEQLDILKKESLEKDKKSEELKQQIEKLKEIDLNIQKKKRNVNQK